MKLNLNGQWYVRYEDLSCRAEDFMTVLNKKDDWLEGNIPLDVHEPLIHKGIIEEPLEGMNCFRSEWMEDKSWWFKKSFVIDEYVLTADNVELVLESLDIGAAVILNGKLAGMQTSSFYPFRKDVKKLLKEGENLLLIRLTTGLDMVDEGVLGGYNIITEDERRPGRGDKRRAFLRKPQYSYGWDWGPKVSSCGIAGNVFLEIHDKAVIRWVHTYVKTLQPEVRLGITMEVENLNPVSTIDGQVELSLNFDGSMVSSVGLDIQLNSGINFIDTDIVVKDAKLWWPNGMGEQPLYDVKAAVFIGDCTIRYPEFKYGIRTVSIDRSRLREGERLFVVTVNGVRVFCKGGNWIPADSIYIRVSDEKYEKLILEAKEANFNMLRIWGGGLYERDIFYGAGDSKKKLPEYSILEFITLRRLTS